MKIPDKLNLPEFPFPTGHGLANEVLRLASAATSPGREQSEATNDMIETLSRALLVLANQSWRITTAAQNPETKESKPELSPQDVKKISNALEAINETLENIGIKVLDRINQPFDPGFPDQVITEEPREGITKEQIIRTIRPTIIWNQTIVQRGEIDIAVPASKK